MRNLSTLLLLLLVLFPNMARARELVILDFIGYGWETAAFPPSAAGDVLSIPLIVDNLSASLGVDFGEEEVTGYMSGLVSEGAEEIGPGLFRVRYSDGTLSFHRDTARDHDFGEFPPNATSPSTFTNGTLCLRGDLQNFTFYYHVGTGAGSMQADVLFNEGACMDALAGMNPSAFTFGGFLTRSSGSVIAGYDLQLDGFLEAESNGDQECEFDCFAVTGVRLEQAEDDDNDDDDDGEDDDNDSDDDKPGAPMSDKRGDCLKTTFSVAGGFEACAAFADFDPEGVEITVRIGGYLQTLAAGSLQRDGKDRWEYDARKACGAVRTFVLEQDDGAWEFKVKGRGVAATLLLPQGENLQVTLSVGSMTGSDAVELEVDDGELVFESDDEDACSDDESDDVTWESQNLLRHDVVLKANPNPFHGGTTLFLQTPVVASATIEVYDLRGRVVRLLHDGQIEPGDQQWQWDGSDDQGIPVASGIYFYRVRTSDTSSVYKLIRMK